MDTLFNARCIHGHEWYEPRDETVKCPTCGAEQVVEVDPMDYFERYGVMPNGDGPDHE